MLKSGQYDVLHLCTSASMSLLKDLVMISLAQKHHVHTVVHFHFGRIPQLRKAGNWEWKLLCRVVRKADIALPIDQMSYDALASAGFTNVEYLPNPVAQKVSDFVGQHSGETHRDERMVFYAGHCIKTKGIYELVQACSQMKDIRLVLAGHIEEETKRELEELAHHEPWLVIKGELPHEEILRLMLQCGVYVLPPYATADSSEWYKGTANALRHCGHHGGRHPRNDWRGGRQALRSAGSATGYRKAGGCYRKAAFRQRIARGMPAQRLPKGK